MSGRSIRYCRMLLDLGFCRDISQCPFRHRLSPCAALAAAGAGRSFHAVMHCSKVSTGSSAAHNAKNPCSSAQPLPARSSRLSCSVSSTASQADHPAQPPLTRPLRPSTRKRAPAWKMDFRTPAAICHISMGRQRQMDCRLGMSRHVNAWWETAMASSWPPHNSANNRTTDQDTDNPTQHSAIGNRLGT